MSQPNNPFSPIHAALKKPYLCRVTGLLLLLSAGLFVALPASAQTTNKQTQIDALNSEMNGAMEQVRKIVNQPVTRLAQKPGMNVATYSPGWFHPGAKTPDFINVDVRTSQEFPYAKFDYVSSDLNPGVMFPGRELEFNSNTKYFYTDRSLPKKKLTEPEMLEINRLYRIIGHCKHQLLLLQNPEPGPEVATEEETPDSTAQKIVTRFPMLKSTAVRVTLVVLALLGIVYLFRRRSE
jgi:hypothetical protein